MHSSRMRTDRALAVFLCCLYLSGGVVTPPGHTHPCGQTDACENITLATEVFQEIWEI